MILDGKEIANELSEQVRNDIVKVRSEHGLVPTLAVILVGDDPASQVYVSHKKKQCHTVGMNSLELKLSASVTQEELLEKIQKLNNDEDVNGILVQLPLPDHIDKLAVINAIDPAKDVDGFHPHNVGLLSFGEPVIVPCTPMGCLIMIKRALGDDLTGKLAIMVGHSNIVGKPMATLLLKEQCTVLVAHEFTQDLPDLVKQGDIVVVATGVPKLVKAEWIKPGATVIDVGITRVTDQDSGKSMLVGDVDFDAAKDVAGAITPVPGGVGPMTIACLLKNTLQATCNQHNVSSELG